MQRFFICSPTCTGPLYPLCRSGPPLPLQDRLALTFTGALGRSPFHLCSKASHKPPNAIYQKLSRRLEPLLATYLSKYPNPGICEHISPPPHPPREIHEHEKLSFFQFLFKPTSVLLEFQIDAQVSRIMSPTTTLYPGTFHLRKYINFIPS